MAMLPDVQKLLGLDVGCGEGHNTRMVAKRGARLAAVDISDVFIRYAQEAEAREPLGIEYRVASALVLPYANASFDFATAFMSLMDMPEVEKVLSEIHRVLSRGGPAVLDLASWARYAASQEPAGRGRADVRV